MPFYHHEQELNELKEKLLHMASLSETAITRAIKSLTDRDEELARKVEEEDSIIDQFEIDVDDMSIALLAKAPLASDLRLITTAMKISHDLERVGDGATTIARRSLELMQAPALKPYIDIPRMASLVLQMLKDALDAFVNRTSSKAREVVPRDKEIDLLNKQLHRELVGYMIENPETIGRCLCLMVIAKTLERIGDHATNIAEEVVFLYEGRDIRHMGKLEPKE